MPFWPLWCESKANLLKMFRPGYPGWSVLFIWENFHPGCQDLAKTEILVTGPARPLIWTHQNFYQGKSGEARSQKPSQPGWPMKRPWVGKVPIVCSYDHLFLPERFYMLRVWYTIQCGKNCWWGCYYPGREPKIRNVQPLRKWTCGFSENCLVDFMVGCMTTKSCVKIETCKNNMGGLYFVKKCQNLFFYDFKQKP